MESKLGKCGMFFLFFFVGDLDLWENGEKKNDLLIGLENSAYKNGKGFLSCMVGVKKQSSCSYSEFIRVIVIKCYKYTY